MHSLCIHNVKLRTTGCTSTQLDCAEAATVAVAEATTVAVAEATTVAMAEATTVAVAEAEAVRKTLTRTKVDTVLLNSG